VDGRPPGNPSFATSPLQQALDGSPSPRGPHGRRGPRRAIFARWGEVRSSSVGWRRKTRVRAPPNRPSPLQRAKDRPLVPKVKPHLITIPPHPLDPKRPISPTLIADHFRKIATLFVVAKTRRIFWAARSGMIRAARFSGPNLSWPRERNSTRLTPLTPPTPRTALTSNSRRL
jgi:hypothetical protein